MTRVFKRQKAHSVRSCHQRSTSVITSQRVQAMKRIILCRGEAIVTVSSLAVSCTLPTSGQIQGIGALPEAFSNSKSVVVLQGHGNVTESLQPLKKKTPMAAFYETSPKQTSISYL